MTLLELLSEQTATIVQLHVPAAEQERLEARGISIGATISKPHKSHATQPVVVSTHTPVSYTHLTLPTKRIV